MRLHSVNTNIFVNKNNSLKTIEGKNGDVNSTNISYDLSIQNKDNFISFGGLNAIPMSAVSSRTNKDKKYLKGLAKVIKCDLKNLKAIIGLDEFKGIMRKATASNFDPNSDSYMINTHTHSLWSDGGAEVKDILDEAQQRGYKSGKNFLIGITDHDSSGSAIEAIKLIAEQPHLYKNIRFMVGIEPCLKYHDSSILKMPIPFDAVAYCINPFKKTTKKLFEAPMKTNRNYARACLQKAKEKWGIDVSYEKACDFHPLIKTGGSTGFLKYTKKYVEKTLEQAGINYNKEDVLNIFKTYYANQNGRVTKATTDVKYAIKLIKSSRQGEIGIAHPGIIELNPQPEGTTDLDLGTLNLKEGVSYNEAIVKFIKTCGLKIAEVHYQYQPKYFEKYPQFKDIINVIKETCSSLRFLATGGTDSHGSAPGKILSSRY